MQDLQGWGPRSHSEPMATIWCNGDWHDSDELSGSWSDRGLLHGLGLFETVLAVDGQVKHVERHLARLQHGLTRLGWELPKYDLEACMVELLKRNGLQQGRARLRFALSGGSGSINDLSAGEDQLCWMSAALLADAPKVMRLGVCPWRRNEHSPLVGLKCASYAENLMALDWARRQGFDEVLFQNTAGHVSEAATANLFLVKDGVLLTPSLETGCLPGVTRDLVIGFAADLKMPIREACFEIDAVKQADEVFLTSATRGVMPVDRLEDTQYQAGSVTAQFSKSWEHLLIPR